MSGLRYPAKLREEAIRLYLDEEISAAAVAKRLGLKPFTVKDWLRARGLARSMSEAAALSVRRKPRGYRGAHIEWRSDKTGRIEIADSTYEAARMMQLDADPDVLDWWRCHDRIPYQTNDGRTRFYVPDLSVARLGGRRTTEEVKPSRFIEQGENPAKFAAARQFYAPLNIEFVVVSEVVINIGDHGNYEAYRPDLERVRQRKTQKRRERQARQEAAESPEQRLARLDRLAAKKRRLNASRKLNRPETPEQAELRRKKQRVADARRMANESPEKRKARLALKAKRAREARAAASGTNVNTILLTVRTKEVARETAVEREGVPS